MKKRLRCLFDGHKFDGDGYSYPNCKKPNGKFGFDICTMCGPSCGKGYIDKYLQASPHLLNWLHLHVHRDLKIEEEVPTAPDPRCLACNRRDGQGLTIKQFREFRMSHRIAEKISHLPIDLRVWVQERQLDCSLAFHEVVRSERLVADMLFKDHKAKGLPIPKTLLNEAAANEEKAKQQKEAEELQHLQNEQQLKQQTPVTESTLQAVEEEEEAQKETEEAQEFEKKEEEEEVEEVEEVEEKEEEEHEMKTADPEPPTLSNTEEASTLSALHPIHNANNKRHIPPTAPQRRMPTRKKPKI